MTKLELILRAVALAQLLLLAWLMLRARRRRIAARLGAAFCVSLAAFVVTSTPSSAISFGIFIYPLTAVCAMHPVLFWMFCSALFADRWRFSWLHAVALGAMSVAGVTYESLTPLGSMSSKAAMSDAFAAVFAACSMAFATMAPVGVFLERPGDLDPRRRRIRAWFVPMVAVYLVIVIAARLTSFWSATPTAPGLVAANLAVMVVMSAIGILSFVDIHFVNWLELTVPRAKGYPLSRVEGGVLEQLNRRLVTERLFAREGLSIAALAEVLGTQEHILRRVINRALGFRNFNDFLHSHRLREAAERLRNPAESRIPVLTIALESGYSSIGPFNRAFKERFRVTPTAYRRRARSGSDGSAQVPSDDSPMPAPSRH